MVCQAPAPTREKTRQSRAEQERTRADRAWLDHRVDIDLPKKPAEIGVIRRMFLDPTASHLIICTSLGENYYLHSQSRQPRALARLRGVSIECVAWNPALPTASTREILIGASDGNIYEAYIETANEFYRKEEKFLKVLQKLPDGPVTGLWVDVLPGRTETRRVMVATQTRLFHLTGKVTRGHEGGGSIYTRLFEAEQPVIHELSRTTAGGTNSSLVVSPDPPHDPFDAVTPDRVFAWLNSQGVYHGKLLMGAPQGGSDLGARVFADSKLLPKAQLAASANPEIRRRSTVDNIDNITLTQWHVLSTLR